MTSAAIVFHLTAFPLRPLIHYIASNPGNVWLQPEGCEVHGLDKGYMGHINSNEPHLVLKCFDCFESIIQRKSNRCLVEGSFEALSHSLTT